MVFSVNQKDEIFVRRKSIYESSYGFSLLALYINSDHSDAQTTKPALRKECVSSLFWFDKQSHVTKVVSLLRQINCHAFG